MQVRRREFLHLLASTPAAYIVGCGDDSPSDTTDGTTSGGSSGTSASSVGTSGTTTGPDPSGSTDGTSSSEGSGSSGSSGSDASSGSTTGEPEELCPATWWMCENYAPTTETDVEAPRVSGTIPASLQGLYVRNGPNPSTTPSEHWFLGDGMVHGVSLGDGAAQWYRSRYVQTPVLGREGPSGPPTNTDHQANTSLLAHQRQILALNEVGLPYALSPADLSTTGVFDFGGALDGPMTAHPTVDPVSGELVFFGYHLLMSEVHLHFVDAGGTLTRSEHIPLPEPTMMHDFCLTQSSVVLMDYPVVFDIALGVAGEGLPFRWAPELGARFGVMPRGGTADDVVWIDTDVGYVFHTVGAYDDPDAPGTIILDAIWYDSMWVEGPSDFENEGTLVRFSIDPGAGTVTRQTLSARATEFPRIDPRIATQPYRYVYTIGADRASGRRALDPADTVFKWDLQRGTDTSFRLPDGLICDELVYTPDTPGAAEDEGWLLGYAYDRRARQSSLIVLDASDIEAGIVGRVDLGARVPHGFHGLWMPL